MSIQIGDKAPKFSLRAHDKSMVQLTDFLNKNVVLLFVPAAFTGVCTKEFCMMRDGIKEFEQLDAQILGISVDSLFTLEKWREMEGFNFPLLSDFNKTVSKKYGAFYKEFAFEMKGVAKRAVFVIDKKGVVRHKEILDNAGEMPNFDAVREVLENLN